VGYITYLYSQTPTLHRPHLRALKVCQQKFPTTQCFGLLPLSNTATNRGEQIMLYRGLTVLYKIGKIGVLQCMSFLIFSFNLSEK